MVVVSGKSIREPKEWRSRYGRREHEEWGEGRREEEDEEDERIKGRGACLSSELFICFACHSEQKILSVVLVLLVSRRSQDYYCC